MEMIFLNIVLVLFPILIYLVLSCLNIFSDKKVTDYLFILTIITSLYFSINFNMKYNNGYVFFMFSNIPILLCYLKKKCFLGIILSWYVFIILYLNIDNFIYITLFKYVLFYLLYLSLCNNNNFNDLLIKYSALIQGFLISFEYLFVSSIDFSILLELIIMTLIIFLLTFASLYLFNLSDNINNMHVIISNSKRDSILKDSLFKLTHEVKNPIAVCKGYLDMIDINNRDSSLKYLDIIRGEIGRSLNIMNDFMEYSKIKINKEEFDMSILLESVYESFKFLGLSKNIEFYYDNDYEEIYVNGDYYRLEQVFVNIIKNSIESITDNGIIKLSVKCLGNSVIVTVTDNGCGMEESELSNIKEMFYTTKRNGTGLGVALSNEIIMSHNGTIDYSSSKDVGTTCTVTIPI